jgi:hypothetical protein
MNTQKTNTYLRLIAIGIVAFSFFGTSCTSLQQATSVATDDLYFTPNNKVVSTQKLLAAEKAENGMAQDEEYQEYQSFQDDRYLRLKVANRNRWSTIDDFNYWNNPSYINMRYGLGWGGGFGGWGFDPFWGGFGGWGFDPFWGGGFGYAGLGWGGGFGGWGGGFGGWGGGFGYAGLGWGGFGYGGFGFGGWGGYGGWGFDPFWGGGFGYGGWNPYFAGYYHPYGGIYNGGVFVNNRARPYQSPTTVRSSPSAINAYRNNRGYNNSNNSLNTTTGNTRYTSNPTLNSNFGNLMKRVVTSNSNTNYANSYDRPARYFSNNNNYNGGNQNQTNSSNNKSSFQSNSNNSGNSNAGGRSGGFNSAGSSAGSPRASRIP